MDRKKVLFVLPSLVGGGAERVAALLLEHLERERFQPSLALFEGRCDYAIPEDVPITCLNKKSRYDLPRLIWRLARAYEKERPDVVLSFMDYANLISVVGRKLSRNKPRLLLNEQNHVSISFKHEPLSRLKAWAIPQLYPRSDGIICVSRGVGDDLVANFGVPPQKIKVIYNPVDIKYVSTLAEKEVDHPYFTTKETPVISAMGRLTAQKGYPYLLRAFARVTAKFPCRLVILGEGKEKESLGNLVTKLGIVEQVAFLGFQQNPFKYMAQSDVFVLSSLWEGLSMVILEAMACGVPVISTRCPSGPDEIITDGINGLLVPVADEGALAQAMLQLLNDKELATRLAQAGRKRAEDFAVGKITKEYEGLFSAASGMQ